MKAVVFFRYRDGRPSEVEVKHHPEYPKYWRAQWRKFSEYIGVDAGSYLYISFEEGEAKYSSELNQALKAEFF